MTQYQPKTGQPCGCKPGVQRDNCPDCEGTGQRVDFAAIRALRPALKTETNTPKMERLIRSAARQEFGARRLGADFEHGQWWVTDLRTGAQWSVCDANTLSGFCFERVTQGDEED